MRPSLTFSSLIAAMMIGGAAAPAAASPVTCDALAHVRIAPAQIGLPTAGAVITSATADVYRSTDGGSPRATPYCRVTGRIASLSEGAEPISFQLNLPADWNGKLVMYGGGGFNGLLITGLDPLRDATRGTPTPLERGYATVGQDSGHRSSGRDDPEPARFALNDEMFRNYAYESYKKLVDVSRRLIESRYGKPAVRVYYFGGSEGGREGLVMAQRYPRDIDGVVSAVPVIGWTGLFQSMVKYVAPQRAGGTLDETARRLVADAVMRRCDALDGIKDGVVSNYMGCRAAFKLTTLACPPGQEPGGACLTAPQIATLRATYDQTMLAVPLANGANVYPGRFFGGEIQPVNDGLGRWVTNGKVPEQGMSVNDARGVQYGQNYVRLVIARDPAMDSVQFDPTRHAARIREVAAMVDTLNPDLSTFFAHGGKLIIRENGGDMAQSPEIGFRYYDTVATRVGKATAERSLRLYVSPASSHTGLAASLTTGKAVPTEHDLLADLDAWVSTGKAPADHLEQVATAEAAPHAVLASRPMCRYPLYPRYVGGDPTRAASYRCQR